MSDTTAAGSSGPEIISPELISLDTDLGSTKEDVIRSLAARLTAAGRASACPSVRWGAAPGRRSQASTTRWAFRNGTARIGAGAGRNKVPTQNAATLGRQASRNGARMEPKGVTMN